MTGCTASAPAGTPSPLAPSCGRKVAFIGQSWSKLDLEGSWTQGPGVRTPPLSPAWGSGVSNLGVLRSKIQVQGRVSEVSAPPPPVTLPPCLPGHHFGQDGSPAFPSPPTQSCGFVDGSLQVSPHSALSPSLLGSSPTLSPPRGPIGHIALALAPGRRLGVRGVAAASRDPVLSA